MNYTIINKVNGLKFFPGIKPLIMQNIQLNKKIAKDILDKNRKREKITLSKYACLSDFAFRLNKEEISDKMNIRPAFFHDTDKIIHSQAYARYIDKTQVFYLFENDHITHRVLHVQLVSKIARVIGRALSLNEDLIEAISLAHDIGHAPYGHDGELKLNEITFKEIGEYFSHNSQSVRALRFLENNGTGLNLTLQVLDGILCHNGELMLKEYRPDYQKTPEKFEKEYESCWTVRNSGKSIISHTLEGCVMRIADVIAYIGRDLEDAITLQLISRKDIPASVRETIGDTNALIINNFVLDLINNSYNKDYLALSEEIFGAISEFYAFSNKEIYQHPVKTSQDHKIRKMFDVLFETYLIDLKSGKQETSISKYYLAEMNRSYREKTPEARIVCDYIAGMTDDFFNSEFKKIVLPESIGYNQQIKAAALS